MKHSLVAAAIAVSLLVLAAGSLSAVNAGASGPNGPDVTCSRIGIHAWSPFAYYDTVGGVRGYAIASTSCNAPWEDNPVPDTPAEWIDGDGGRNPVIAQQLYRLSADGTRIEQVGLSWVKHSFCAVDETTCGTCQANDNCDYLALGCADTYAAILNGNPPFLGPRWEVNPIGMGPGAVHDDDFVSPAGSTIAGLLQVADADITNHPDARFFAEIQYVTHDEQYQRRWNNASYREVFFNGNTINGNDGGQDNTPTIRGYSAVHAWADNNPAVNVAVFEDDPGLGRFELGWLVTDNGDGTWTYEYALRNHNSDRAANRFSVPVADSVGIDETGFHDVHYHSGDGWNGAQTFDNTDWGLLNSADELTWSTADFTTDPNANALRWGTMYNFRFTANAPPVAGDIIVGMYKGGGRDTVTVSAQVPDLPQCPADIASSKGPGADGTVNLFDLLLLIDNWGSTGPGSAISGDGGGLSEVDLFDLLDLLEAWGNCAG